MADDTVQLTDLEVIQQFSLAVRGATASRRDVIAALEADLAYLGGRRSAPKAEAAPVTRAATPLPTRRAAAPAKAPAKKAPAKATRARRG